MKITSLLIIAVIIFGSCAANNKASEAAVDTADSTNAVVEATPKIPRPAFNADSAYLFVDQLVAFGPRVPNTSAHVKSGDWLVKQLKSMGWDVTEQKTDLEAFDGTVLKARNIFAQINPEDTTRILLVAHWDSRPWSDKDPDPEKKEEPVLGANDGASGVGVILEIARQLSKQNSTAGVDILFVDAEDWGTEDKEESWCLGTRYFAENSPYNENQKVQGILLDMVGSPNAQFRYEYFSKMANSPLLEELWTNAAGLGYSNLFIKADGGAVTDDHLPLTERGIPTIDIIDYRNDGNYIGFDPVWHTSKDDMKNISKETLGAVGETVLSIIQ